MPPGAAWVHVLGQWLLGRADLPRGAAAQLSTIEDNQPFSPLDLLPTQQGDRSTSNY